jgi:hypothetical protein
LVEYPFFIAFPSLIGQTRSQIYRSATPIVVALFAISGTIKVVEYRFYLAILYSEENGREISGKTRGEPHI